MRRALGPLPGEKVVQQYGSASANEILVRLPQAQEVEQGTNLERARAR